MSGQPGTSMEERLVALCNRLAEGLELDIEQVGAERLVATLTEALAASGLRIALYDNPSGGEGED